MIRVLKWISLRACKRLVWAFCARLYYSWCFSGFVACECWDPTSLVALTHVSGVDPFLFCPQYLFAGVIYGQTSPVWFVGWCVNTGMLCRKAIPVAPDSPLWHKCWYFNFLFFLCLRTPASPHVMKNILRMLMYFWGRIQEVMFMGPCKEAVVTWLMSLDATQFCLLIERVPEWHQ